MNYKKVAIFGGPFDLSWAELAGDDLALRGTAISEADADVVGACNRIAVERHVASNWLAGKCHHRRMGKLLLHVSDGERRVADAGGIYYAEAASGNTRVRRRSAKLLVDVRELNEVARAWQRHGFVRIHQSFLVNPECILRIRKRPDTTEWEVVLAPPVNAVLPVSRRQLRALWAAFE
jgi:DNA-binding LytR/AlgR family response regulator